MARGTRKGKPNRKSDKFDEKKKSQGKKNRSTNGRDIKHRHQFKRRAPAPSEEKTAKRRKVEQVPDEQSGDEIDAYQQLLSTFSEKNSKTGKVIESDDEEVSVSDEADSDQSDTASVSGQPNLGDVDISDLDNSEEGSDDDVDENVSDDDEEAEKDRADSNESESIGIVVPSGQDVGSINGEGTSGDLCDTSEDEDIDVLDLNSEEDMSNPEDDPYVAHICSDLVEEAVDFLGQAKPLTKIEETHWETLGRLVFSIPQIPGAPPSANGLLLEKPKKYAQPSKVPVKMQQVDLRQLHVKVQLHNTIAKANLGNIELGTSQELLTPRQLELFTLMNSYQDLYYPERTLQNGEEVRFSYCLHAANHVIKARNRIMHHNAQLSKKNYDDIPEEYRDTGLVRPKVLILVPLREQARRVVEMLCKLLVVDGSKGMVMNQKRFEEEFTGDTLIMPKKHRRPEDYEALFAGNTDDTFRLGLTLTRKSVKLYADFYSADIIVSSPLGLRMIIGAEGEAGRDYDFLASVEMVIVDQAEIFLMQNWDHLLHVWDHLHLQPKESHGTDFSRVRQWALNGWAKHYRQTILLSSIPLIEFSSLLNKRCSNYSGSVRVVNPIANGTICQVVVQLPQVFQRLQATCVSQGLDVRFEYLVQQVLPNHTDSLMSHTMIYVPSYFDYVRIRNYMRKERLNFVQICEYAKEGKIARARDMFYHSQVQFLLYSERFHFFRRPIIKGIRHIIFYQPPTMPHFFSEMCNQMQEANQNPHGGSENNMTVTVLYNKFDSPQLSAMVGSERASRMIASDRSVHMFISGE